MNAYQILKIGHISFVVISVTLFVYRYARLNIDPLNPLPNPLKVLPHLNDTLLLACAVGMVVLGGFDAFGTPWLVAKLLALVLYILAGTICLHAVPRSPRQKISFVVALAVFAYILLVGISKQVVPFWPATITI